MSNKRTIKIKNANLAKLDWSEAGRMASTMRRIQSQTNDLDEFMGKVKKVKKRKKKQIWRWSLFNVSSVLLSHRFNGHTFKGDSKVVWDWNKGDTDKSIKKTPQGWKYRTIKYIAEDSRGNVFFVFRTNKTKGIRGSQTCYFSNCKNIRPHNVNPLTDSGTYKELEHSFDEAMEYFVTYDWEQDFEDKTKTDYKKFLKYYSLAVW